MTYTYKKYSLGDLNEDARDQLRPVTIPNGIMCQVLVAGTPDTLVYVALDDETPVAMAMLRPLEYQLRPVDIFVKSEHRRKGVGTALMALVKEDLKDAAIDVEPFDDAGDRFYEKTLNYVPKKKAPLSTPLHDRLFDATQLRDAQENLYSPFLSDLLEAFRREDGEQ